MFNKTTFNALTKCCSILLLTSFIITGCSKESPAKPVEMTPSDDTSAALESTFEAAPDEETPSEASAQETTEQKSSDRFGKYSEVLDGTESFFLFNWANDDMTIDDFKTALMQDLEGTVAEDDSFFAKYTFVDLNGDSEDELVLYIPHPGYGYLILSDIDGKFYGTAKGHREFEELQKDGKYLASGGAGDSYFYTMSISTDGFEDVLFAEQHGEQSDDGTYDPGLVVNGEPVEVYDEWYSANYSDPVDWTEF